MMGLILPGSFMQTSEAPYQNIHGSRDGEPWMLNVLRKAQLPCGAADPVSPSAIWA